MSDLHPLYTRWGKTLDKTCPLGEYPRPQLKRETWLCLNGVWQYAISDNQPEEYDGEIIVPFSPETKLSGVGRQLQPGQTLWYRRVVHMDAVPPDKRLLLHFGAVDQRCEVFVNGRSACTHSGGYWPFHVDITDFVCEGDNTLTVAVRDDSDTGDEAYGKQKLQRGGIWYTAQSGIWQTVWAETVPQQHIESIKITPRCETSEVEIDLRFPHPDSPAAHISIFDGERQVAQGSAKGSPIRLPMQGFKYWSPDDPVLYTVRISAGDDEVESYFGMRQFGIDNERLTLNGQPIFHNGLLDQGYWSDGLYTAPCDEAMIWELSEIKKLGFNMLRKHIKIEPLRWYYHCDRLGILVWQDIVNGGGPYSGLVTRYLPFIGIHIRDKIGRRGFGRADRTGRQKYERDLARTVDLLFSAVSLAVWVPFNEGWGQFDANSIADELRRLDSTRPIDHASGWHDQGGGDIASHHVYYKKFRFKPDKKKRVQALTEFGGYSCPTEGHMASGKLFGYRMYKSKEALTEAIAKLYKTEVFPNIGKGLAAAIYTQVSDVEDEINGLFTYDRAELKVKPETIREIMSDVSSSAYNND
jgi:hypothetical protein